MNSIVEGLRGDAFRTVKDLGLDRLKGPEAVPMIVEALKKLVFPRQEAEAKELVQYGTKADTFMIVSSLCHSRVHCQHSSFVTSLFRRGGVRRRHARHVKVRKCDTLVTSSACNPSTFVSVATGPST